MTALLKENVNSLTFSMVMLTVENNRESFLPGIARCFIDMADRAEGITKVSLTTADKVSGDNRDKIIKLIEEDMNTKVELEENIDPEIRGGFTLKVDNLYLDASVRSWLRKIRKELMEIV
jgi:F-type H+-transporting ATPase subunit delta